MAKRIEQRWHVNNETGCWEWLLRKNRFGYAVETIKVDTGKYRHGTRAHRNMWIALHGPIPLHMYVDHICNNKSCVNPNHLRLLTHTENLRRGAKLYPEAVKQAKVLRKDGFTWEKIRDKLGINCDSTTIRYAVCGRTWKDIA